MLVDVRSGAEVELKLMKSSILDLAGKDGEVRFLGGRSVSVMGGAGRRRVLETGWGGVFAPLEVVVVVVVEAVARCRLALGLDALGGVRPAAAERGREEDRGGWSKDNLIASAMLTHHFNPAYSWEWYDSVKFGSCIESRAVGVLRSKSSISSPSSSGSARYLP